MPCQDCSSNAFPVSSMQYTSSYNPCGCEDGNCGCSGNPIDSKCIFYTGPALPCGQIATNDSLEDILIKIDQKLCSTVGNYQIYSKYCLDDSTSISSEQEFVEAISQYVCQTRSTLDTFTGTTFVNYQSTVNNRFIAVEVPGITCSFANVISTDSIQTVLNKYCTAFGTINSAISLSGVQWDSCLIVDPDPTTIAEGFNVLIGQICDIRANVNFTGTGNLPTFNNVGSCLPGTLTGTDSLVSTVNKIKDRLCSVGTFDINALTWGCTSKPSTSTTDLQGAFNAILAKLSSISQALPVFSADFTTALTNSGDACQGVTVNLAATSILDKYVAVDGSDASPGTLMNKLIPGTGISFDTTTTPGKLIVNGNGGGSSSNGKVKSAVADPTADFLENKIEGNNGTSGIIISTSTDAGTNKVSIQASVDGAALWNFLLTYLESNPSVKAEFCEKVQNCLPDCVIPPNVTVIYSNTNSTTTTTTTTTGG